MNRRRVSALSTAALALFAAATLPAQAQLPPQRAAVTGTVRASTGEVIAGARVRAIAGTLDTTVRTGTLGTYELRLPSGTATFRVTNIGYAEVVRTVAVESTLQTLDFTIVRNAERLGEVQVSARWMGVRGVIADDRTRQPLADAVVSVAHRNRLVTTDSTGHFALELPVAEHTVLQIAHPGYHTRAKGVDVTAAHATDVLLFLTPGDDSKLEKEALGNLGKRLALGPIFSFTTSAQEVTRNGGKTVNDALYSSGLLQHNGLRLGNAVCVFVDGKPMYGRSASRIDVDDVDFLEVYNDDPNATLKDLWGDFPCPPVLGNPQVGNGKPVRWILVWTKK